MVVVVLVDVAVLSEALRSRVVVVVVLVAVVICQCAANMAWAFAAVHRRDEKPALRTLDVVVVGPMAIVILSV